MNSFNEATRKALVDRLKKAASPDQNGIKGPLADLLEEAAVALRPLPETREEVARPEDNEHPNVASGLFARETEDQAKALPPAPMPEEKK